VSNLRKLFLGAVARWLTRQYPGGMPLASYHFILRNSFLECS